MPITFARAKLEDAEYVGRRLRAADLMEVMALGHRGLDAVVYSFYDSDECYTAFADGKPCMIFGMTDPILGDMACAWALGTEECSRYPVAMVRYGRMFLRQFLERRPVLVNWCDARYAKALKWLMAIGFKVYDPAPIGERGALFCKIEARKGGLSCAK